MKKILLATTLLTGLTVSASAADFDNTQLVTKFASGSLEFGLEFDRDGLAEIETTARTYEGELWGGNSYVDVGVGYDRVADELSLGVEGGVVRGVSPELDLYGSVELSYVASTDSLSDGDALLEPTVGAIYSISPVVAAYGEVAYAWNVSNDFASAGGELEVGAMFAVTDAVTAKAALVQPVDQANTDTQLKLETALRF